MIKRTVKIQIKGQVPYDAEAELDVQKLDPEHPPDEFTGRFLRFK